MAAASISTSMTGSSPLQVATGRGHQAASTAPRAAHDLDEFHPPIAKNFSFSVSHIWRSNNNMLRWVTDVPGVHREAPLEPAQFHGEKHALEPKDTYGGHDGGEHRDKRAKHYSSSSSGHQGPSTERRRHRILQSTRNIARSLTNGIQRIITPSQGAHDNLDGSTLNGSFGSPPGTPATLPNHQRLRFVFVGDSACGKSSLLLRFYRDAFTQAWAPTQYELFNKTVRVDGQDVDVELWDTSGKVELNQLALLSYLSWDAVFVCFSVNSDKKFASAQTKWTGAVRAHCRGAPVFLLGLKKDTRVGSGMWAPLFPAWETRIGATEGSMAASGIGAIKYMECSARTGEGVERVFEEGVRIVHSLHAGGEPIARQQKKSQGKTLGKLLCF